MSSDYMMYIRTGNNCDLQFESVVSFFYHFATPFSPNAVGFAGVEVVTSADHCNIDMSTYLITKEIFDRLARPGMLGVRTTLGFCRTPFICCRAPG
jgi:hypothetical protein